MALTFGPRGVAATFVLARRTDVHDAVRRIRRLLDLDADMSGVGRALGPLAAKRPGIRSVGAADEEEIVVRAVVGQQISVAGARTVLGRLAAEAGEPLDEPLPGVTRLFPRAGDLAGRPLPMPRRRARTLAALDGADPDALEDVPGIGPWTAGYVRMRLGDPDVLLTTDLVIRRELERRPGAETERWSPFRSYATHQLWAAATASAA